MKDVLLQTKIITVPATTQTTVHRTLFKADDCYKYLSGVATVINGSAPSADIFQLELRDDYDTVLSFSPFENWLKNTQSVAWNLQDTYKPLNLNAMGRNFWLNVKVKNLAAPYSFAAVLKQSNTPIKCVRYDQQTFTIPTPYLGSNYEITLPSNYSTCKGFMVTGGDTTNAAGIAIDFNDSFGSIYDPVPLNMVMPTVNTPYDLGFYPLDFPSASHQINVRLTDIGGISASYTPTDINVTFLLVR